MGELLNKKKEELDKKFVEYKKFQEQYRSKCEQYQKELQEKDKKIQLMNDDSMRRYSGTRKGEATANSLRRELQQQHQIQIDKIEREKFEQYEKQRNTIQQLEKQLLDLQHDRDQQQNNDGMITKLEKRNQELENKLNLYDERMQRIENLEQQLEQNNYKLYSIEQVKNDAIERVQDLEQRLKESNEKLAQQEKAKEEEKFCDKDEHIDNDDDKRKTGETKGSGNTEQIQLKQDIIDRLEMQLLDLRKKYDKLYNEQQKQQQKMENDCKDGKDDDDNDKVMKKERQVIEAQKELKEQIEEQKDIIMKLELKLIDHQNKYDDLEKKIKDHHDNDIQKEQLAEKDAIIDSLQEKLEGKITMLEKLQTKFHDLQQDYESLNFEYSESGEDAAGDNDCTHYRQYEIQLQDNQQQLMTMQLEYESLRLQHTKETKELEKRLQASDRSSTNEMEILREKMKEMSILYSKKQKEDSTIIESHYNEIMTLNEKNKKLQNELNNDDKYQDLLQSKDRIETQEK